MADALIEVVVENLFSLIQSEFATISGIKGKIERLSSTLDLIKAVIEDAEQKQLTNNPVKVWLQQLKDAVHVLDDILDECSLKSHQLGSLSFFKPKNIRFRHRIGNKLNEITKRFDQIAEAKNKFLLREGGRERSREVEEWRETSSIIHQPQIFGRDDDREKIVEFLLHQTGGSDFLSVYPIVGLGGVGKTTLAQLVYNDERVSDKFKPKIWVCVSDNFSIKNILCSIIQSITKEKCDGMNLDVIQSKVQELLHSKRYLMVLDDVWKANQQLEFGLTQDKWNKLKSVLSCGAKGASILVSTRDQDVATIMGTCQAHHLAGLSEDQCWLLFKQYAFGPDKEETAELVAIGKEIVKKCAGSPLAAQALGGLMSTRSGANEWLEVEKSTLWTLPDENSIFPALRLSYFYLTSTLKQCFAFCAIFPKDFEIVKEDLIHLWMANGLISSRANLEVEDVGNMVWNELYQKSFFQDIQVSSKGDIYCKMHDLVHDLAQSIMGPECLVSKKETITDFSRSTHHISFSNLEFLNKRALEKVESLRTLYKVEGPICDWFSTKSSLRVLCIRSSKLSSLGNLIHLRYLEIYGHFPKTPLPDSICRLRKLEILKLNGLTNLLCLPKHMSRLQNLRHLIIEGCYCLDYMFPNIRRLSCLRTLSVYIVRLETGHNLAELHDLKLGGKLSIRCLGNVGNVSEAQEANLTSKKDLKELCLSWDKSSLTNLTSKKDLKVDAEQVLEALQPHSNLERLILRDYTGEKVPSWMGILHNLNFLKLWEFNCCSQLPSLGKLQSLRELYIYSVENVQHIDDNECFDGVKVSAFPSLKKLSLRCLPKLERLLKVERGEMFPNLSDLLSFKCPKLGGLPSLPFIKSLFVRECNNELLMSISSLHSLTSLHLREGGNLTSFPEGMIRSLTCLKTLEIFDFPKLNELPNELFNLNALEILRIMNCEELESLPEQVWEGLHSLKILHISGCSRLRSLPDGFRHLTSLQYLEIYGCPTLQVDEHKIAHIPYVKREDL